jgi:hypothetical protein
VRTLAVESQQSTVNRPQPTAREQRLTLHFARGTKNPQTSSTVDMERAEEAKSKGAGGKDGGHKGGEQGSQKAEAGNWRIEVGRKGRR